MKKLAIILFLGIFIAACGGGAGSDTKATTDPYDAAKSDIPN